MSSPVCPVWWMSCPPGSPGPCPCPLQLGPEPLGVGGEGVGGSRSPPFSTLTSASTSLFPSKGSSKARQKACRCSQPTVVRAALSGWPGGLWGRAEDHPSRPDCDPWGPGRRPSQLPPKWARDGGQRRCAHGHQVLETPLLDKATLCLPGEGEEGAEGTLSPAGLGGGRACHAAAQASASANSGLTK